ncbi:MAG: hypothetical protein A2275_01455 [Bacteroidetes bacterium RIFOXYA12_FULL_35_11]|nr:MAG: hypothetical protein A2X01_17090 [Bacteroidetes bacterium GWF2_35_48]OFY73039.1 MAG: hypothetical protein A2275_01455 [Bacteroidetes bacterium RIFOXYA12_FULL_35_11]OFY93566.1 MAG: hypothetical protein A2309_09315 [Bacteroidetes bacterium RIFOXYB2_FULL_35_7]OFY96834.1 MAG: hypothetical protein A2491_07950 [Bacteroidetes bacterium RIFOXYC12_FULL_35_7]HBX53345.1 cell surface protein [Bacteroidales bacterium]
MKSLLLITFFFLLLISCKKYPIGPQPVNPQNPVTITKTNKAFIICEGNYNWGNASLSVYNIAEKQIANNVFQNVNQSALGDVAQSFSLIDSTGFIVVNNSSKIEVINTNSFKVISSITGLNSPRYMTFFNEEKAFVSSLYGNKLYIVNPKTFLKTGEIQTGCSTEKMLVYYERIFICNWSGGNKVLVINGNIDQIIHTINVVKEPNSIVLDKNNKIWILCSGGFQHEENAALLRINPDTYEIETSMSFQNLNSYPVKLSINKTKDTLYYLNQHVFQMSINENGLPASELISGTGKIFYGLNVSPESEIFVSDAADYVQPGTVFRYNANGVLIDSFNTGVNPGEIVFAGSVPIGM